MWYWNVEAGWSVWPGGTWSDFHETCMNLLDRALRLMLLITTSNARITYNTTVERSET